MRGLRATLFTISGVDPLSDVVHGKGDFHCESDSKALTNWERGIATANMTLVSALSVLTDLVRRGNSASEQLRAISWDHTTKP